jgi:hypothetical protein
VVLVHPDLLYEAKSTPELEAQLLFQEARERGRRRRLIAGITLGTVGIVLAVTVGLTVGRNMKVTPGPTSHPPLIPAVATATVSLNFRPVMCEAPALGLGSSESASNGSLPACSPSSQLAAANLAVNTSDGVATANPPADPKFSSFASTPPDRAAAADTVLLPGASDLGEGTTRFVLGPAGLT